MVRAPRDNFKMWDVMEIYGLLQSDNAFLAARFRLGGNSWFWDNWYNCLKAIEYFYSHIMMKYIPIDPRMPLKLAAKNDRVIQDPYSLSLFGLFKITTANVLEKFDQDFSMKMEEHGTTETTATTNPQYVVGDKSLYVPEELIPWADQIFR